MTFDLSPAPGRTPVALEGGWTAVLLEPLPGAGVLAVGFFLAGELELLVEDEDEVRRLERLLTEPGAGGRLLGRRRSPPR